MAIYNSFNKVYSFVSLNSIVIHCTFMKISLQDAKTNRAENSLTELLRLYCGKELESSIWGSQGVILLFEINRQFSICSG